MKAPPAGKKAALQVLYWGRDDGREFEIQVDGAAVASPKLQGGKDDYYSVEYPLAEAQAAGKDKITVRIQGKLGEAAGAIYDLRIVTVE